MNARIFTLLSLLMICGFAGCEGVKSSMRPSTKSSTWNPITALKPDKEVPIEETEPVTVSAIWTDSVYEKPGTTPVVGFGGRFFFYDDDSNPVKADGELVIYGFDDSKDDHSKSGPDKKFVFRKTEFQSHYSDSGLGPSYSVWIPWEKFGGTRKMITLIPVFRRADGVVMKCGQSTMVLRGEESETDVAEISRDQPYKYLGSSSAIVGQPSSPAGTTRKLDNNVVQQVGFESQTSQSERIKTSTIKLPPSLAQRIAANNARQNKDVQSKLQPESEDEPVARPIRTATNEPGVLAVDNSFPLPPAADQPSSSTLSSKSIPRKVFGSPGTFN